MYDYTTTEICIFDIKYLWIKLLFIRIIFVFETLINSYWSLNPLKLLVVDKLRAEDRWFEIGIL